MQNIPLPNGAHLGVVLLINLVKNSLMLELDIMILRAKNTNKGTSKCKNNAIIDGIGLQKEIKKLANKHNGTDKDAHIDPFIEFYNRFLLHTSLIASKGLLLHALTFQTRDSTHDSLMHA